MSIIVGEVISINGIKITIRIFEESSKDTLYHLGDKYKGVAIREYVSIQRGFRDIICIIEGEYLDENKKESNGGKTYYIRKVDAKPIGYFDNGQFNEGIKFLPMIKDPVYLIKEESLSCIYSNNSSTNFVIGEMLKEEIPISLPWQKIFNTHIGIFGNTGSGKSNTLTALFTTLFESKANHLDGKSKFIVLDFNGEYTGSQLLQDQRKQVLSINTQTEDGDKFPLYESEFWDTETLSILFKATPNTQRPFLNRIVNGRNRFRDHPNSFSNYIKKTFREAFCAASPKPDTLDLLRNIASILNMDDLEEKLREVSWHTKQQRFVRFNVFFNPDGNNYDAIFAGDVNRIITNEIDSFQELIIRANLQLVRDLIVGFVQFEHIQPLLKRIDSSLAPIRKTLAIVSERHAFSLLTVISLRKANQEIKKILPLLIAKHFYNQHKEQVKTPPDKTLHLIIDEAHNILSQQSSREQETWKDYRLELFEEIIKEGRKFGIFLTLSSQRPADISATVISQIHNFFIHRLVNDRDLFLLENTISTLDSLSRSMIPNLSKGSCIVTGTSFDLPMVLQIYRLHKQRQPDSEDVDLLSLWNEKNN